MEPVSVDLRARSDADVPDVDPWDLFARRLPDLFERRADLLEAADRLRLRDLVIDVDDDSWTLRRSHGRYEVVEGAAPRPDVRTARVRLDRGQLSDLVNDQTTPVGLMTGGTLHQSEGRVGHLLDWWLVLRSVLDARPVHDGSTPDLPADLRRSFRPDDDPAELRTFLEQAGFLHLSGVFTAEEMTTLSRDMDELAGTYSPDDGHSWWATLGDGTERLVRMQGFDRRSPAAAALLQDPRFTALGAIAGVGHEHTGMARNGIEALFKPVGVAEGISDVPWHKDCSLGRHSYDCCSLTVGISVTGAGSGSGQLRVVAGSHRVLIWPALLDPATTGLPEVELPTSTGDVTIHLSCTLHMAEPPVERERRVLYTSLKLPPLDPAGAKANTARLVAAREQAPRTIAANRSA